MDWRQFPKQFWRVATRISNTVGTITFIVAAIGGVAAVIWAWCKDATAPFIIPAGAITFAAVLYAAEKFRGNATAPKSQADPLPQIPHANERLEELIADSERVRSDSDFNDWIGAISEFIYFRIGPEEIGQPYQDTLIGVQADFKKVGLDRSIRRTMDFLKTIR
jgi:hypothetical protein